MTRAAVGAKLKHAISPATSSMVPETMCTRRIHRRQGSIKNFGCAGIR